MRRNTVQFAITLLGLVMLLGATASVNADQADSLQQNGRSSELLAADLASVHVPNFNLVDQSGKSSAYPKKVPSATGVEATSIVLGSMSPAQGANAEPGDTVHAVLSAYFDDVNQRGGICGRRILLRFADAGLDSAATVKNAKRLVATPIFAMVAPFVPGAEKKLAALAHTSKMPVVGLMALSVPDEPTNREVFYLLPGFEQLEQELVRFSAVEGKRATDKTAVVVADAELQSEVSPAMRATWKELGADKPREFSFSQENGQKMIHDLQGQGIDTVFFVGEGEQAAQWIQAAERAEWTPKVFVLGPLMDENILAAPARFQGKIFAAYPQLQPELGAVDQFEEFLQRHKLTHDHRLLQISAYSAAKILEDALVHAGKNVTREKLILQLEQMRDFKTGLLPGITFGVNRRIGSFKAEIVCADLVSHTFQPECGKAQAPE